MSGWSVSLSSDGTIVAIGAINENNVGATNIYQNISGTWTKIGSPIYGTDGNLQSGYSVSISANGQFVAIGAIDTDFDYELQDYGSGNVQIYQNVNNSWIQVGSINGLELSQEGISVALSSNGQIVAIYADMDINLNGSYGAILIYQNINNSWVQLGNTIPKSTSPSNFISISADGYTVEIAGDVYYLNQLVAPLLNPSFTGILTAPTAKFTNTLQIPTSIQSNPTAGTMYFNTSTNLLYIYNGTTWFKFTGVSV